MKECYIYANAGNDDGTPQRNSDIIYNTVRDEIIQVSIEARMGQYLRCLLPEPGWVYCPDVDIEYHDAYQDLESEYEVQRERDDIKAQNDGQTNVIPSKPIDNNVDMDNKYDDYGGSGDKRRNYREQEMQKCTLENAPFFQTNEENQKCFYKNKYIRNALFFFRRRPFVPGMNIYMCFYIILWFMVIYCIRFNYIGNSRNY